jgi:hypothetical protein
MSNSALNMWAVGRAAMGAAPLLGPTEGGGGGSCVSREAGSLIGSVAGAIVGFGVGAAMGAVFGAGFGFGWAIGSAGKEIMPFGVGPYAGGALGAAIGAGLGERIGASKCFSGDTLVWMGDGSTKRIDEVAIGDLVTARDETTGFTGAKAVTEVFRHNAVKTMLVYLDNGDAIETTAVHRFAVDGQGFRSARQLQLGDKLITCSAELVGVLGTGERLHRTVVHNLSVDRYHTFFVGERGLWVHNLKPSNPDPTPSHHGDDDDD